MQALLEHFITQSTVYSLMAVVLVAFLESLALVGLILPGTVLMAGPIHRVFIDGGGVGGLSGVAGAGRFDSARYGADGGAGSADW